MRLPTRQADNPRRLCCHLNRTAWIQFLWTPSLALHAAIDALSPSHAPSSTASHAIASNVHKLEHGPPRAFLHRLPALNLRNIPLAVDHSHRIVSLPTLYALLLPPCVRDPLLDLAAAHAAVTGGATVRGRIAVVYGTPCPRWHVDKVVLRCICTLYGPGSVVWQSEVEAERELHAGDVVLMRGAGVDGAKASYATTHRSPEVPEDAPAPRIIVQTDCWEA